MMKSKQYYILFLLPLMFLVGCQGNSTNTPTVIPSVEKPTDFPTATETLVSTATIAPTPIPTQTLIPTEDPNQNMITTTSGTNALRVCPDKFCAELTTIKKDEIFEVLQYTESGWYQIQHDDIIGWINSVHPLGKITVGIVPDFGPTPVTVVNFSPEHFSFPIAFDGPYALEQDLRYAPCFHWNPDQDLSGMNNNNWWDYFHAGDMHMLNTSPPVQDITVLSPIDGKVIAIIDNGDNGIGFVLETPYVYKGLPVYVDIAHTHGAFQGDEKFPRISVLSTVKMGEPLAISNSFFQWGRPEQALDIAIRIGRTGPIPTDHNFNPDLFLDPYQFLVDDIEAHTDKIVFDRFRTHCLKSGNFP